MAITVNPKQNKVAVLDEGITLTDDVRQMDFVNTGVTATAIGDDVEVDVPGNPAASTQEVGELLTATGDPLIFTSAFVPTDEPRIFVGSARVFSPDDYSRVGNTYTFTYVPPTTPRADYSH